MIKKTNKKIIILILCLLVIVLIYFAVIRRFPRLLDIFKSENNEKLIESFRLEL